MDEGDLYKVCRFPKGFGLREQKILVLKKIHLDQKQFKFIVSAQRKYKKLYMFLYDLYVLGLDRISLPLL